MIIRFTIILLLFLQFIFFSCNTTINPNIVDEYNKKIEVIPNSWKNKPVIGLSDDIEITFHYDKNGNYAIVKDTEWLYINKKFPNDYETFSYYETEYCEKIEKVDITVLYPDKPQYHFSTDTPGKIKRKKIIEGDYKYIVNIPGYTKGIFIKVESIIKYTRPEFINKFSMRYHYPQLNRTIRFNYPPDCKINFGLENNEKIKITENSGLDKDSGNKFYEAVGTNLPEFDKNTRVDMPESWYASVNFSLPPKGKESYSWKKLGDHYLDLISDSITDSDKIKNLASEISTKSKNKNQIIENSFNEITKRVRYYADEQGKYGFIPRETSEIFEKGYGDCKELSSLLKVMLNSNKVDCNLALIKTHGRSQLLKKYPSLGSFNHMIAFSKKNYQIRFLDPTNSHSNSYNSYYYLIGRNAFLLIPDNSRIEMMKRSDDYKNEINTSSKVIFNKKTKKWIIDGQISLSGKAALNLYNNLIMSTTTQKTSVVNKYLQKHFSLNPYDIKLTTNRCDKMVLSYKNPFQENYISLDKGGFRLSVPSIYNYNLFNNDKKIHGHIYFNEFYQKDTWIFPNKISEVNEEGFKSSLSEASISYSKNTIIRIYKQFSEKHTIDESEFTFLKSKQSKFLGAIAWN